MGKNDKNKNPQEVGVDQIDEKVIKDGILTEDQVSKAAEAISKEKDEKQVERAKAVIQHCSWLVTDSKLKLKKARKVEAISKETLEKLGELEKKILEGKMPVTDFNDELTKIHKSHNDKLKQTDDEFSKLVETNNNEYPKVWRYTSFAQSFGRRDWYDD